MNDLENTGSNVSEPGFALFRGLVPMIAGLAAIALTYAAAAAEIGSWKLAAVGGIAVAFVSVCAALSPAAPPVQAVNFEPLDAGETASDPFTELGDRLIALDEANEVFGSSLNAADMFRLVSSRVGEIFPFAASALIIPGESGVTLKVAHADGVNAELFREHEFNISEGLAGRCLASGRIEIDSRRTADISCFGLERVAGFSSAAAIPLMLENEVPLGVFEMFTSEPITPGSDSIKLLEAIGEHITPIFRNSLAFERTLTNALTDPLTGLPNERAFYMVLEKQLAESIRHRDERPLTVLSIDIRDFGAVNSMLGHSVGDRMLEFVGARINEHLRKMDFLARTMNDEFHVILPTASEMVGMEIVERIRAGFEQNEFEIADSEGVVIALNVGWATFWKDGETPEQLVRAAQFRKRQAKSETPAGVLWFPREYVN